MASRITYPFPLAEVLDATHDHPHLAEKDRDVKREEVLTTRCTRNLCRINVHVLVGSFFPVGEIKYEAYLERLGAILEARHAGHESLWSLLEQGAAP